MLIHPTAVPRPMRALLTVIALGVLGSGCSSDALPAEWADGALTPERTRYIETTSHVEVMGLLSTAAAHDSRMHLTTFGYSNEGRPLPLLVVGSMTEATPESVRGSGRLVVYLQGNIHAGEVAGKEALLRFIRRLLNGENADWAEEMVLLIAPIYNADGNERLDLRNRPRQHGPMGGMGTRANAQGLDLNRDQMKLDSPEARSLAALLTEWDPHVVIDLHTTNGTRHAYHLTYAPPLHPATPESVDRLLRDELFPAVNAEVEARHGWHFEHYGNVSERGGSAAWVTFDHRPRFVTNYAGVRNRVGILSEAYSYATFEERILASERFVDATLRFLHGERERVRTLVEGEVARDLPGTLLPTRAGLPDVGEPGTLLMGGVDEEVNPWSGEVILRRTDEVRPEPMEKYIAFVGTEWETVPAAYFLPDDMAPVVERLRAHGVEVTPFEGPLPPETERFRVAGILKAERAFQGRTEVEIQGEWVLMDGGSEFRGFRVAMDQPLTRLAFLLLEPRADDGFANWGILDPWLTDDAGFPILRQGSPEAE